MHRYKAVAVLCYCWLSERRGPSSSGKPQSVPSCAYIGRIVKKVQINEFIHANVLVFRVRFLGSDKPHLNSVIEKEIEVMIKEYVYD